MIQFENGGRLVESVTELPNLANSNVIYLDFETSSGDKQRDSLNPWKDCTICGIAITTDDHPGAWYVSPRMIPECWQWLCDIIWTCKVWVNHNIKYDLHVLANNTNIICDDELDWTFEICDTLTLAKIIDSDRLSNDLGVLSKDWLGNNIGKYETRLKNFLAQCKSKDYGDVPTDIIAEYACQDVITNRDLYKYCLLRLHEQCKPIWEKEKKVTCLLYDIERVGLCVDRTELELTQILLTRQMLQIEESIHNLSGLCVRPNTNADCQELFCSKYGLPVVAYTEKGNPSFDKDALKTLLVNPTVVTNPDLKRMVELSLEYRAKSTLNGLFVEAYQDLEVAGRIHSFYNQIIRTGRMSCSNPNAQQLSKAAKQLIHPTPGYNFLSRDYSQIEFRIIVHYLNNLRAIQAYLENPNTDFHEWVAGIAGIPRKSAKNLNFAIAFGAGKKKVLAMLSGDVALVGHLLEQAGGNTALFAMLANQHAKQVFQQYHEMLPELKYVSKRAQNTIIGRGYIYNLAGRHRHIPQALAFIAFNTIVQSSAADIFKDRAIAISPRYNKDVRAMGARLVALVHDEFLFEVPKDRTQEMIDFSTPILENSEIKLRVPIRVSSGVSDIDWRKASGD
jgi:DNA polymerase I